MDGAAKAIARIGALDRRGIRKVFEERFSARRMCQDYLDIYRRIKNRGTESSGTRSLAVYLK
jgi:glycosyltransferase involved in cell wall biosynthesis